MMSDGHFVVPMTSLVFPRALVGFLTFPRVGMGYEIEFSRKPDGDIFCFYPCEIILSHIPIPVPGIDKKRTDACGAH